MRSRIVVSVIGGLIALLIGEFIQSIIPKPSELVAKLISWAWNVVSWIWMMLNSSHSILGWLILVFSLLAFLGLLILAAMLLRYFQGNIQPAHLSYVEDMIDGIRWRWRWVGNQISDLSCFCPSCDSRLIYHEGFGQTDLICERCPADGSLGPARPRGRVVTTVEGGGRSYAVGAAAREIERRIRTGEVKFAKG